MIKVLYYFAVETNEDFIKATIRQLLRFANKYSRIEKLPIPVDDDLEITTKEAHTIQAIGERKQMSVTDVANHFGVTKSAASQMVTRLENKGFLSKTQAPHSNKELDLSLTDLGWRAFRAHERCHGEDMAGLVKRLEAYPLQQVAILSVLLEAIDAVMDERLGEN